MAYLSGTNKMSGLVVDTDLNMGAHNITLGASQTVDGIDVSSIVNSGTYTGNDTAQRAIAHGLGVIPKHVLIVDTNGFIGQYNGLANTTLMYTNAGNDGAVTLTGMNATNFYVGHATPGYPNSMNSAGVIYYWIAWL